MANNLLKAGATVSVFDPSRAAVDVLKAEGATAATSAAEVAEHADIVLTAVPDDRALSVVANELLPALAARGGKPAPVHISCSTVSPHISNELAEAHAAQEVGFVAAPVFARPDGMRRGEATIPFSGPSWAKERARPVLEKTAMGVVDFGEAAGSANAVKLGGNFLIAAAIESMAEAAALAESHNVDREEFIKLMNTTIFDCLIYKGYGHRVAARDHFPHPDAHFALDLGTKDISLVHEAAARARCPMPVASLLRDRFVAAQNSGRGKLDWSALALKASEDAGADISEPLSKLMKSVQDEN